MKVRIIIGQLILLFFITGSVQAQIDDNSQEDIHKITREKDSIKAIERGKRINESYDGNWSIGVGINIIDDSGKIFSGIKIDEDWNTSNPFTFTVEYFHNVFVSFGISASLNEYIAGKNIDNLGTVIEGFEASYLAIDFFSKLYFRDFFQTTRFDPYVLLGMGYTKIGAYKLDPYPENIFKPGLEHIEIDEDGNYVIPDIGRITGNVGLGFNFWFSRNFAFNLNAAWKFGIPTGEYVSGPNSVSHQVQYSLGLFYLFN